MKAQVKFRNAKAAAFFQRYIAKNADVTDYGIDDQGRVFWHFANGVTERVTRAKFLHMAQNDIRPMF